MQVQFANVGTAEISLRSGLSAYLLCTTIAFTKAIPKENASAKRKTRFSVEIVKIVFSPPDNYYLCAIIQRFCVDFFNCIH